MTNMKQMNKNKNKNRITPNNQIAPDIYSIMYFCLSITSLDKQNNTKAKHFNSN